MLDIEELDNIIHQTSRINRVVTQHESISVYYEDETKSTFTSFPKFKIDSQTKATASIILR